MNKRKSLGDTCDIFLSRRRVRSHFPHQQAESELPQHVPILCPESIPVPPYFNPLPRPLEVPELSGTPLTSGSAKPLPLPGSSGAVQSKPTRLADGRRHVPRPRNPFILFRCDLVHQRKVLPRSGLDDTNISRIAGDLWREMTAAQKKPWVELAAQEKERHALLYPDYKYAPTHGGSKNKKIRDGTDYPDNRPFRGMFHIGAGSSSDPLKLRHQHERPRPYPQCIPRRRSSSCPPVGAVPVLSHSPVDEWTPPLVTRDDLERRPSRTIMYQSVAPQPVAEPAVPTPALHDPLQGFDWLNFPHIHPSLVDYTYPLLELTQCPDFRPVANFDFNFDNKPTLIPPVGDGGFTSQELEELERLTLGTTNFTDPFSSLTAVHVDHDSHYAFSTAISPLDCSGNSTDSLSTASSSGTLSN